MGHKAQAARTPEPYPKPITPPGRYGWARTDTLLCTLACLPGTFGDGCRQKCQCPGKNQACHPASGACECTAGYHGTDCQQRECHLCPGLRPSSAVLGEWVPGRSACGCRTQSPTPGSCPLCLQAAHLDDSGLAVNNYVGVSMGAPVTQPLGPATAQLGSSGPTAATVSVQREGQVRLLPVTHAQGPKSPPSGWTAPQCPASLSLPLGLAPG